MAQVVPGRLRSRIFFDVRHYEGGRSSVLHTSHLYPMRNPWFSFSEGTCFRRWEPRKKSAVTRPGIVSGAVRLVAQCINHYATPGPTIHYILKQIIFLKLLFFFLFHAKKFPFLRSSITLILNPYV